MKCSTFIILLLCDVICAKNVVQEFLNRRTSSASQKIIVVGANRDIGKKLVRLLLTKGHTVVAVDDEADQLILLQKEEGARLITQVISFIDIEKSQIMFADIIKKIGGLDICILCNFVAPEIEEYAVQSHKISWLSSKETIDINVSGTMALAHVALNHFMLQKKGYLVTIASLDALYGHPGCPCYTASQAFISNYMQGMRQRIARLRDVSITLCDIRWSYVSQVQNTITSGWTKDLEEAAVQMLQAIEQKKPVAYIMNKWSFALWALSAVPTLIKHVWEGVHDLKYRR